MKNQLIALLVLLSSTAFAQNLSGKYGVGLALGEPSGFSVKKFNSGTEAYQFTLGYNMAGTHTGVNLGGDVLFHNYNFFSADNGSIPYYYGAGVHVSLYEATQVYARVPLGIAYEFNELPADVFLEFSPGIAVVPTPGIVFNFALGARYYFTL